MDLFLLPCIPVKWTLKEVIADGDSKPLSVRIPAAVERAPINQLFSVERTRENPISLDIVDP
jgi:hypothetical protein